MSSFFQLFSKRVYLIEKVARILVLLAAFLIPLLFCRESKYLFQIKTLWLQYSGLALIIALILQRIFSPAPPEIFKSWTLRFIWIFAFWQIFKSYDSISSLISLRELSRIFWLVVLATAVPAFFRTQRQLWMLCITSLLALAFSILAAWFWHDDDLRESVLAKDNQNSYLFDLGDVPVLGWINEKILFPEPYNIKTYNFGKNEKTISFFGDIPNIINDLFSSYSETEMRDANLAASFPIKLQSFYPGKPDSGTFGNKNFISAYLNLFLPLAVFYLAWIFFTLPPKKFFWGAGILFALFPPLVLALSAKQGFYPLFYLCLVQTLFFFGAKLGQKFQAQKKDFFILFAKLDLIGLLSTLILAGYLQIYRLENRGSWLGLGGAFVFLCAALGWLFLHKRFSKKLIGGALVGFFALALLAFSFVLATRGERISSIFSFTSPTNELRVHTWSHFLTAWRTDKEFIESDILRKLTGFGSYTFRVIYPKYRSRRLFELEGGHNTESSHPHNEYLGYLGELGLIGLGLYFIMIFSLGKDIFVRLKKASGLDSAWLLAVGFGLITILLSQSMGVAVRYSGVASLFWLLLGFGLALCGLRQEEREEDLIESKSLLKSKGQPSPNLSNEGQLKKSDQASLNSSSKAPVFSGYLSVSKGLFFQKYFPVALFVAGWLLAMPNPLTPINLFRSQHFFLMGEGKFRVLQYNADTLASKMNNLQNESKKYQSIKAKNPNTLNQEERSYLFQYEKWYQESALPEIQFWQKRYDEALNQSDCLFRAGIEFDSANLESLYIGASQGVQVARQQATHLKQAKKGVAMFKRCIEDYEYILAKMPYFVQARYYLGLCNLALGEFEQANQASQANQKNPEKTKAYFKSAIQHFETYLKQDPTYVDTHFNLYRAYMMLQDPESANRALATAINNYRLSGMDLFSEVKKENAIFWLNQYIFYESDPKKTKRGLELYSHLNELNNVQYALPFVPSTQRHAQEALRFLDSH